MFHFIILFASESLLYKDKKGQEEANGRSNWFPERTWLHKIRAKVKWGEVGTFSCYDLTLTFCCKCLYFSESIVLLQSQVSIHHRLPTTTWMKAGQSRRSQRLMWHLSSTRFWRNSVMVWTRKVIKWVFKTLQPRSEMNDLFSYIMKTSCWHFIFFSFQTAELCHLAPSPSSVTPQWAAEVTGAPSTAATATCLALTTHQRMTAISKRSPSTVLTRDRWATPPRRASTHPTLHHRSCPSSFVLLNSDLKYQTQDSQE